MYIMMVCFLFVIYSRLTCLAPSLQTQGFVLEMIEVQDMEVDSSFSVDSTLLSLNRKRLGSKSTSSSDRTSFDTQFDKECVSPPLKRLKVSKSLEEVIQEILDSIEDIPLYLGIQNAYFFLEKLPVDLQNLLHSKEPSLCVFLLRFFYQYKGVATSFQNLLCSCPEFLDIVHSYPTLKELIVDFIRLENSHPFDTVSLNDMNQFSFLSYFNMYLRVITNKKMFEQTGLIQKVQQSDYPEQCQTLLDFFEILLIMHIGKKPLPDNLLQPLIETSKRLKVETQVAALIIEYDATVQNNDFLMNHVAQMSLEDFNLLGYYPPPERLFKYLTFHNNLYLFDIDTIKMHYPEDVSFFQLLMRCIDEHPNQDISNQLASKVLVETAPHFSDILSQLQVVNRCMPVMIYLMTQIAYDDLTPLQKEIIESAKRSVLVSEWRQKQKSPLQYEDILDHTQLFYSPSEFKPILQGLPNHMLKQVVDNASLRDIKQFVDFFSQASLKSFVLPQPSSLHSQLAQALSEPHHFQYNDSFIQELLILENISLVGRTIYGYHPVLNVSIAYKFKKKSETVEELVQGHVANFLLKQYFDLYLNLQTPLGLFQTNELSFELLFRLFPLSGEVFQLFDFEKDGSILYRKYSVTDSKIFHYTYEESLSFEESSYGIQLALKEAGFLWRHGIYFNSVASIFHNSVGEEGIRYLPANCLVGELGKLNNWNVDATDCSDIREGGLADKEDLVGGLSPELDIIFQKSGLALYATSNRQAFFAINTIFDYLLIADLSVFRKYLFHPSSHHTLPSKQNLINAIQMNYVTLFSAITGDSIQKSRTIITASRLFDWKGYVNEFLSYHQPDLEETKKILEKTPQLKYCRGLTYDGVY